MYTSYSKNEIAIYKQALQSAETIFLYPSVTYPYADIIKGVSVNDKWKKAVNTNTTQAFGKKLVYGNFGENKKKAMEVCDELFLSQKNRILEALYSTINTREEMDSFEHELFQELKAAFLPYSTLSLIGESYNRIRKVVELYVEHIVSMASEVEPKRRKTLIPLLFLPIDSWIIGQEHIFNDNSISGWGLTRNSSFGEIRLKSLFDDMQHYLVEKAKKISTAIDAPFHVIYFDVFWGDRLGVPGGNLFGVHGDGNKANLKLKNEKNSFAKDVGSRVVNSNPQRTIANNISYPPLLRTIINELSEIGIDLEKDYNCIQRKRGEYILEARLPNGRRKNIVTIWPTHQAGDIRIVNIGKYLDKRHFDQSDIGTYELREALRTAYKLTQ